MLYPWGLFILQLKVCAFELLSSHLAHPYLLPASGNQQSVLCIYEVFVCRL